jgi:putative ABC transport system substrate-binding protein
MRRRDFVAAVGGVAAWPLAARAQQPGVPVVGYLSVEAPVAENLAPLLKGMGEQGYVEGRNVAFQFRNAERYDRLPELAAELVARRVAVIVTSGSSNAARAAKAATRTIPIVSMVGSDPVALGLVASLNRPGGNVTGVTFLASELGPKRLQLLHELVPRATTIVYLVNPSSLNSELTIQDFRVAASSIGKKLVVLNGGTAAEIDAAFAAMSQQQADALLINNDAFYFSRRDQLLALAARQRIPTVHFAPEFARAGGLMSYSDDRAESRRQTGLYVGRILKGEKPADLPVLQPVKFDFVINLKAAKALGIEFPPSFHLRATEVIE